jgi:hypothetical protein
MYIKTKHHFGSDYMLHIKYTIYIYDAKTFRDAFSAKTLKSNI